MRSSTRARTFSVLAVAALLLGAAASAATRPTHKFKTPGAPAFPLAYRGFLWVAAHRGGELFKINPRTNRVVHTYETIESSCLPLIGTGDEILFASCGPTGEKILDIRRGRLHAMPLGLRFYVHRIRSGVAYWGNLGFAGSEWISKGNGGPTGTIERIDPKTHVVLKRFPGIDVEVGTATATDGSLWIPGFTSVARIDPSDDTLTIIPLPGALSEPGPGQGYANTERLAVTPGAVWVTNPAGLYRIDEKTNLAKLIPGISVGDLDQFGYIDLVAAKGSLFMRNGPKTVLRIDPSTGKVTATYPASGGGGGIEVGFGSLWVTNFINDTTWRVPLG